MWVSELTEENLSDDTIDKLLFEGISDEGKKADCIIVLGSIKATKYRVPVAVNAYKNGRAPKIMMCGGAMRNFETGCSPEARQMYQKALELGVPGENIIVEEHSQNTIENVLCAMLELQRDMWLNKIERVLLVTTTYHMRRSLHIAEYLFPAHIEVCPCPADDTNTKRDNWRETQKGKERARKEALNILQCVANGVFPDFEIGDH